MENDKMHSCIMLYLYLTILNCIVYDRIVFVLLELFAG